MLEILFQSSYITIRTFNLLLALGFVLTGLFIIRYCTRNKFNLSFLMNKLPYLIAGALLLGRGLFVIENWAFFQNQWISVFYLWDLRFSFFGLLYGMILTLLFFCKKEKESFWLWLDISMLSLLIMMLFIHVGQFFNGQNYGIPTDLPWAIAFNTQNIPYLLPIHPTQLYAALGTVILFIYSLKKDKRVHLPGVTGTRILMIYSLMMLGIDFLHGIPSNYNKISFLVLSAISFILLIHCSHRSHISTNANHSNKT